MTEEIRLCAAALFRILGKDVATVDEFVMEGGAENGGA